jgi:hypothetical protein
MRTQETRFRFVCVRLKQTREEECDTPSRFRAEMPDPMAKNGKELKDISWSKDGWMERKLRVDIDNEMW